MSTGLIINDSAEQQEIIDNSLQLFNKAPGILIANQDRTRKAIGVGESIIDQWSAAWQIEDEGAKILALQAVDERSNKYLVNCNTALGEEKAAREAITKMMDMFKGWFTACENPLDKAKDGTVPNKVQQQRNKCATELKAIGDRKQREFELEAARKDELIEIRRKAETDIPAHFEQMLLAKLQGYNNSFAQITLENFDDKEAKLKGLTPIFNYQYEGSKYTPIHCTQEQVSAIYTEVYDSKLAEFEARYNAKINETVAGLIEKLPSLKAQLLEEKRLRDEQAEKERLQQIELARLEEERRNAKSKLEADEAIRKQKELEKQAELERIQKQQEEERLEALRLQQQEAENQRLALEAQQVQQAASMAADTAAAGAQTMNLFEKEAAVEVLPDTGSTKEEWEIEVLNAAGWVEIFTQWMQIFGMKQKDMAKLGNTKLDQMKAALEKEKLKNQLEIKSNHLKYHKKIKAINKKQ